MTYLGAFRIPPGSCGGDQCSSNYGGQALGFDAQGNGGNGSLYVSSLDTRFGRLVAEISTDNDLARGAIDPLHTLPSQMPIAKLLQPWGDVWAGRIDDVSPGGNNWVGGLYPLQYQGVPRLLATAYASFGVARTNKSHFILARSTTAPQVIVGPVEVNGTGTPSSSCGAGMNCPDGWVAGSSVEIPAAYQAALGGDMLSGLCCVSVIGRTSLGPTATRWKLADLSRDPVVGKKLLGYPSNRATLGRWTTGSDGATNPPGSSGGAELFTSQNDLNRMFWPTGYRTLAFVSVLGNVRANCYGAAVAGDADGDPVTNAIGEQDANGTDASTDATGTIISVPNVRLNAIPRNAGKGYIWLSAQTTPAVRFAGRNYQGMAKIIAVSEGGTARAAVTVAKSEAFPPNLTGQAFRIGSPACYDPATHGAHIPDNQPRTGHGPTAYPYKVIVMAYDADGLAQVNAGRKQPWDLLPYATWELPLPVAYPAGKYATKSVGAVALDPVNHRIFITQRLVDAAAAAIVLVYSFVPGR